VTNLIAEGRQPAICRSIQFGKTSKGDEQIAIGFEIVGEGNPDVGRQITYFGMFTDTTIDFTVEALRNCGWQGDELAELPRLADEGLLPNEVSLVIEHEEWEGKWREKVKWVNRPGGGKVKLAAPLDDQSLGRFSSMMKSKVRAAGRDNRPSGSRSSSQHGGGSGNGQRRDPHPNAPGNDRGGGYDPDGDIPFATPSITAEPSSIAPVLRRSV
jgi:hypothetical protein